MSNLRLVPSGGVPIDVPSDRALIGRDPGADIVVNDPSVSRRHALLERRPEGWVVYDQRSANGTWVNEQRVEQAALQNGLQLRLGAVSFGVVLPGAGAARGPATLAPQQAPAYQPPAYAPPAYAPPAYAPPGGYPAPAGGGYPPPGPAYAPPPAYPPGAAPSYPPSAPGAPAYPPAAPAYAPPGPPAYAPPGAPNYPGTLPPTYSPPGSASVYPGAPPGAPGFPQQPGGYGPPGAPQRPPPPPPPPGGMSEAEAAEIIGLWPGSPADEVRRRYQKLYNDFQIRLTNAPTPSLKKMYQKNIQDLKMACELISPGAIA